MDEQNKYEVIKKLVEESGNKDRASMALFGAAMPQPGAGERKPLF